MAWVRIHDGALTHPRLIDIQDWSSPFFVWIWGLSYCQLHLTDGAIPVKAVPNSKAMRAAAALFTAGLWTRDGETVTVRDYLQHNDSRDTILAKRKAGRDRVSTHRSNKRADEPVKRVTEGEHTNAHIASGVFVSSSKSSNLQNLDPNLTNASVTERAGRFCERYADFYEKHRNGAKYRQNPMKDYQSAVSLCGTWTDDERLDKLAIVFLTTDHQFAESGSRTITQFAALASWCDGKLAEWEARRTA